MHTLLNSRYMDAIEELRARKTFAFPCEALLEGRRFVGLLGPRTPGQPNEVQIVIAGERRTARLGQVSIGPALVGLLETVGAELDYRARTEPNVINARLWAEYTGSPVAGRR